MGKVNKKLTGKQLYIFIFLFLVYMVIPIILFSMYVNNEILLTIGFILFFIAFVLAMFAVFKSWFDK